MPRPLRLYEPNVVYELTTRTIQGRFLLRPSREANELIAGIIGRAQHLYPEVKVYGVVALSNHLTWLASSAMPSLIPEFMGFVNGRISWELGRPDVHDWAGPMWERATQPVPICDDEALVARFKYLLAQGCKEHLVRSPRQWPGVSCVPSLLEGRKLEGRWYWRDDRRRARNRGERVTKYSMTVQYEVKFEKIPCWEHLSDAEYSRRVGELVDDIEDEARAERRESGKPVLGVSRVLAADPHTRCEDLEKSPAPRCHASTKRIRDAYDLKYFAFVDGFRAAAERLKQGLDAVFPLWSFPPRLPFVTSSA